MGKIRRKILVLLVPLLFFIISLLTLGDYGISWDEPIHFQRGQAYLHYFLTGETRYESLPIVEEHTPKFEGVDFESVYKGKLMASLKKGARRSYYQHESINGEWFLQNDGGHPPLNGIMAAGFNKVFYQNLGIMGDIESHHLFNVLSAVVLVLIVAVFAYQVVGVFGSIVASLSIALYPLFFAESHFNIKDPSEAAFFAASVWAFWMSFKEGSWRWLIVSAFSFALALGTKFNIFFLPFIIFPYLLIRHFPVINKGWRSILSNLKKTPRSYIFALAFSPIPILAIFLGTWPFLWQDLWGNTLEIFRYYKQLGTGAGYQPGFFLPGGFNTYPVFWIFVTTPPWILFLTFAGIIATLRTENKEKTPFLWLLWFMVPIARVSIPNTTIYGGARQIMEYIPAMALLSGLGAYYLKAWLKPRLKPRFATLLILVAFVPQALVMVKLHPNENVYFNSFVGGLSGARERSIPSWGNSFGNAYYQGIKWLNENAEKNARLSLIQGTYQNIPIIYLRDDIQFWNGYWSGINRGGEYIMELTHDEPVKAYPYAWDYVGKFLEPVYEVKVDGVAIAKIWKNDLGHTKFEMRLEEVVYSGPTSLSVEEETIQAELSEKVLLSRFVVTFNGESTCTPVKGRVEVSLDGKTWQQESEPVPFPQINEKESVGENRMQYFFPEREAKAVRFIADSHDSCILNNPKVQILVLE